MVRRYMNITHLEGLGSFQNEVFKSNQSFSMA